MKKLIFALLAIMLLGGAGAGGYFYFGQQAIASVGETDEHQDAKGADKKEHKKEGHYEYVELDPLILPIIDQNGVTQVISLVVVIEVEDSYNAEKVEHNEPRLKDAYIQEMYGVLNKQAALRGGVVQVGMIKDRLKKISRNVMPDDIITDVLLQVVQQKPI